jgi:uncharacterized protein YcgI (DUF1989 family)
MPAEPILIPARHGKAARVRRGQRIRVINTHGSQVLDGWAFADPPADGAGPEFMSMAHTRSRNSKVWPAVGDVMFSDRRRPMLTWLEDTSPGLHDTLLPACSPAIYAEHGCPPGSHRSCAENLREALAEVGFAPLPFTPDPLNLFMNIPVGSDGAVERLPPVSRPGDHVLWRAELDLVIAFSACPQDITPLNGPDCTPRDAHFTIEDS